MERVLKRLYFGQISPEDRYYEIVNDTEERRRFEALYEPFEEKLKALGLLREFEAVNDAYDDMQMELEAAIFAGAFCLGARMMLEVLDPHMVF